MIEVQKAMDFIKDNGNQLELARLNNLFGEKFDSNMVLKGFSELQNPDGGFPFGDRPGWPSCLSNTAQAVHVLQELKLDDSDIAQAAMNYFLEMQHKGFWPENEKIAPLGPPFWDMPGDDKTTLWLTADITDLLLRSGYPGEKLSQAADFIRDRQAPDGKFMGYVHTTWMALSVFGKKGLDDEIVYSEALAYLEKVELDDWDAASIAWCLDCMKVGCVVENSPLWNKLTIKLAELQDENGSWPSEDGEHLKTRNVNSVLAALLDIVDI